MKKKIKKRSTILLLFVFLFLMVSVFLSCRKSNVHPLPWGQSVGNPEKKLKILNKTIIIFYKKNDAWPTFKQIQQQVAYNDIPVCLFYSYNKGGYQIAIWSGETTWVYNSLNNSYYEFNKDVSIFSWYDVNSNTFFAEKEAKKNYGLEYTSEGM